MRKTYVLAPSFSIGPPPEVVGGATIPPEGRYQLGDILTDPFGAKPSVLNRFKRTPIPAAYLETPDEKDDVSYSSDELWGGKLGFFATILAYLGIGPSADVGVSAKSESSDVLKIKTLETREFDAREDYIRRVLASRPVDDYIGEFGTRTAGRTKPVELYMISGLKIAKEASSFTSTALREAGGSAGGGAGAAAKAKLVEITYNRSRSVSFETSKTDFVLALQLVRIRYAVKARKLETEVSLEKAVFFGESWDEEGGDHVCFKGVDQDVCDPEHAGRSVLKVEDETSSALLLIPELA